MTSKVGKRQLKADDYLDIPLTSNPVITGAISHGLHDQRSKRPRRRFVDITDPSQRQPVRRPDPLDAMPPTQVTPGAIYPTRSNRNKEEHIDIASDKWE